MLFLPRTWFLAAGFVLLWNSGFIGAEYALPYTGPLTLLFWRYWILAFVLAACLTVRRRWRWPGWPEVMTAAGVGILAHGVWLGCVFVALQHRVPAGLVALIVALQPLATGALSGPIAGERTPGFRWVGLMTGLLGVILAVAARTDFSTVDSIVACFIPFGSVAAITIASLIQRRLHLRGDSGGPHLDEGLLYQSLGTALAVTIPAVMVEGLATEWTLVFAGALAWLTLAVSLSAYGLMWLLVRRMDATRVASLFYFGPPVTMLMAWAAFGDQLRISDLAGLSLILAGVLMTQMKPASPA